MGLLPEAKWCPKIDILLLEMESFAGADVWYLYCRKENQICVNIYCCWICT